VAYNIFCPGSVSDYPFFCFIFPIFIHFCMSKIWMDKSNVLNHSLFYFETKAIKLALQLSLYFVFFALSIILFLNDHNVILLVYTQENQEISWNKFDQYPVSKVQRLKYTKHYCKISILYIMITSVAGCLRKRFCENIWTQKWYEKIHNQLRINFSKFIFNWMKTLDSSLRAKSVKFCMSKNYY